MSYFGAVKIIDSDGDPQGLLMEDNCLTARDYLVAIAEQEIASHSRFSKIGYTPTMTTAESEVWSKAGAYVFPSAQMQMQLISSYAVVDTTRDIGTVIKGNAEGANQTILCDAGGNTTTLIDASVDFTAATGVAVGDCVLLDPKGTSPEWGYITDITNAATGTLVIGGGFSSGGSCATARAYTIVDKSPYSGAHAVKIDYLDNTYAEHTILMCLNGNTGVNTAGTGGAALSNLFRINSFRVIAAGSGNKPTGSLSLTDTAPTVTYSYITALFTRARNSAYTVPLGKTLFVNKFSAGFSLAAGTKWEYARMFFRTNREPSTQFLTQSIFYPDFEIIANNQTVIIPLALPKKIAAKTDIKVSGIASAAGVAMCSYRGWLETN